MARNPFRSEAEMFRFLGVVIVGALLVVLGAWINVWVGVVVAVLAVAAVVWWLMQEPVPGAAEPTPKLESHTPEGTHRVLVLVAPGGSAPAIPDQATQILVVVPALASTTEALTGAVDDRRAEAEQTAESIARALSHDGRSVRCEVGADDPVLAVEDALRTFGADEIVVAGDDAMVDQVRARVAVPVKRA
jgi:hypothetical protein